jgi:hypothetical protein
MPPRESGSPDAIFDASLTSLEAERAKAPPSQPAVAACAPRTNRVSGVWPREIRGPPPVLYVHGNPELLGRHGLLFIGSRRPSHHGNQMAVTLRRDLAERGLPLPAG